MTEKSTVKYTVIIDKELLQQFSELAKANHRTAAQLVREYIQSYVKSYGSKENEIND